MPQVRVSLVFTGNHIPLHDIAAQIGILPAKVRKKEDWPRASVLAGVAKDTLVYCTDKAECTAVCTRLDEMQSMFRPKVEIIQNLIKKYALSVHVTVVVEAELGDYPELVLTRENIDFLSAIHAEAGFDLYIDDSASI